MRASKGVTAADTAASSDRSTCHRAALSNFVICTLIIVHFHHTQFLISAALWTPPRASGPSQAITKFALPTFTPLSSPSPASSITAALPSPAGSAASLANRIRDLFPTASLRRVSARYVNGSCSDNKRALRRSRRFICNHFFLASQQARRNRPH